MELEYPLDNGDVLFYSAEFSSDYCIITEINTDAVSTIDFDELVSVGRNLGADGTNQTNETPFNVVGFFEQ